MTTRARSMARAVAEAIDAAPVPPTDVGAVQLAHRYAQLIDAAAPSAKYARLLRTLEVALSDCDEDSDAGKALRGVAEALSAHSVASDLGPKLLAVLTSLGLTAAGRGAKGGSNVPAIPDELAEQRKRAADRRRGVGTGAN